MAKKRITLPTNFSSLIEEGNIEKLKATFEKCELNAYERDFIKKPALCFYNIPIPFMQWLLEQGADIEMKDSYERTPLFYHSQVNDIERVTFLLEKGADIHAQDIYHNTPLHFAEYHAEVAQLLLEKGADIKAKDDQGHDVVERMLSRVQGRNICQAAEAAKVYLQAGYKSTPFAKEAITRIGEDFEFHRANFNSDYLNQTNATLQTLYQLFAVSPVPKRIQHDGKSPIILSGDTWEKQYEQAWNLLVPGNGKANTLQGEVIRIAGRINDELLHNGMGNWDRDYRKMLSIISNFLKQGNSLTTEQLTEVAHIQKNILEDDGTLSHHLCKLTTLWVSQNPNPIELEKVPYNR